jgi:hypothetical protein
MCGVVVWLLLEHRVCGGCVVLHQQMLLSLVVGVEEKITELLSV